MKSLLTLFSSALVALALTTGVATAQSPIPLDQLRLKNERVLQTPYWWAWGKPDDDVKRPLNVLTEADAQRMIQAYGEPYLAFFAARGDMFYEPGTIITQVFTSTLSVKLPPFDEFRYDRDRGYQAPNMQRRVDVLYLAPTYAMRETVTNTIRYRSPNEEGSSVSLVAEDSPYNRYRFVIEDYANDRIVGVNLNRNREVVECELIARAILERPITVWSSPVLPLNNLDRFEVRRHKQSGVYEIKYGYFIYDYSSAVVFEPKRLRPLIAQHSTPLANNKNNDFVSWSSQFAYDQPIPDFLSSPACRANRAVQTGVPAQLDALFGGQVPGVVRIAHVNKDVMNGQTHLRFSLVADRSLEETAGAVKAALERGLKVTITPAQTKRETEYKLPKVSYVLFSISRFVKVDAIALDANKTLVRGWVTQ